MDELCVRGICLELNPTGQELYWSGSRKKSTASCAHYESTGSTTYKETFWFESQQGFC